jgi:hypothetical protein
MQDTSKSKLSPHTVWLFAIGSIAAALGVSYALSGMGQKVTAAVYFAIVAVGGFLSTYATRARVVSAILAFLLGAGAAAGGYWALIASLSHSVTNAVTAGSTDAAAVHAGNQMANTLGIFVAVIVFLETFVAGCAGSVAGAKSRGQGGLAALASATRAAQG